MLLVGLCTFLIGFFVTSCVITFLSIRREK